MTAKKRTYKTKTRKVREISGIVSEIVDPGGKLMAEISQLDPVELDADLLTKSDKEMLAEFSREIENPMIKALAQEYVVDEFSRQMQETEARDMLAMRAAFWYLLATLGVVGLTAVLGLAAGLYALLVMVGSVVVAIELADRRVNW